MESNNIFKPVLFILFVIIIIIIIIICIYFFLSKQKSYLNPYTDKEINSLRNKLTRIFSRKGDKNQIQTNSKNLVCCLNLTFKELELLIEDYKDRNISLKDKDQILKGFINYIKTYKGIYSLNNCVFNRCQFINNMPSIIKYKYKFAIEYFQKNKKPIIFEKKEFKDSVKLLGLFLTKYKYNEKNDRFIGKYQEKYKFLEQTNFTKEDQKDFKKALNFTWRLGSFICNQIEKQEILDDQIKLFDKYIDKIVQLCNVKEEFPFGYDWFLFVSQYPIILSYKLYIDYVTKNIITSKYILEILKYIPKVNYSRQKKRQGSDVAIMSIGYIIANLFKYNEDVNLFYTFLEDLFNSETYNKDIVIQYQDPQINKFQDGLYFDGGFITHQELVSYNYLLAYLYPSLFYKVLFNQENGNINKIFRALHWIALPNRRVNPIIVSRFGRFDEMNNVLSEFVDILDLLKVQYKEENNYIQKYRNKKINIKDVLGIKIIESGRVVAANFPTWSIQLKINSELAYGEIDIYNKRILKQSGMSKIMFFDNDISKTDEIEFQTHSIYPGVLAFKNFLNKEEELFIQYGVKPFSFPSVKYSYIQLDNNTLVIYSVLTNNQTKLEYEEILLITEYGIFVGYFNIKKDLINEELYLTIESDLINTNVKSGILFSDNNKPIVKHTIVSESDLNNDLNNDLKPKKTYTGLIKNVDKHVLYYNHILNAPEAIAKVEFDNKKINISIDFDRKYSLILDKSYGITARTD